MKSNLTKLLLLVPLAACADKPGGIDGESPAQVQSDLEKDTGGFATTDEAAEFGMQAEFDDAAIEADTPVADTLPPSAMPADAATVEDVLVMWGKFPPEPNATVKRDWSGSIAVNTGAMRVGRAVAFEDRTDQLLPRTDAKSVAFDSITRPASDGLALALVQPAPSAGTVPAPVQLTYTPNVAPTTGPSLTIDVGALADGPVVLDAGDGFHMVAAGLRHDDGCRGGFMRGRWRAINDHLGGYLGMVVGRGGDVIGHVRGIYGTRADGTHVMFGKFIDRDGHFIGLLKGTYDGGEYHAKWIDRAGEHGVLGGKYFEGPAAAAGAVTERGAFLGRWAETGCAEDPAPASP